jgi:hypothetical protein
MGIGGEVSLTILLIESRNHRTHLRPQFRCRKRVPVATLPRRG